MQNYESITRTAESQESWTEFIRRRRSSELTQRSRTWIQILSDKVLSSVLIEEKTGVKASTIRVTLTANEGHADGHSLLRSSRPKKHDRDIDMFVTRYGY